MDFLKRLGFYLIGFSVGIVFLVLFLKKKSEETGASFCYFPNCRTLKDIRSKPIAYSDEMQALLANQTLDTVDIKAFLNNGDVDFGRSDTKSAPCKTYFIEGEIATKQAVLKVKNCPSKAIIETVEQ
ncbi:DUF4258 domain-containing protein [Flavobacteriaceae bacterium TP-CH-4]|uniref:DUF4258 domain-containing protein n=1 Tax=Pelagihabitans pacificus TaxID=2696054 RepID=A0A967AUD7_9FLAO|nr:DUF4258 domain-containing protein [Pelagihabitans pacificus]NHF60189.1 DUF4258 domain-containing protein [Pelagihabitans pacificus]